MKKHVNYFLIVAFVLIAGFALMRGNVFSANAAEQTKENVTVCENGHTPANEWVIKRSNLLIARVKAGDTLSIIDKNLLTRTIKRDKKGNIVEKAPVNYYVTAVVSTEIGKLKSYSPRTKGKWVATRKNNVPALRTK